MTSQQEIPQIEDQEEPRCEGCQVWGHPHIVEKPAWWYEPVDESSSSSNDAMMQEAYLEPLTASQESVVVSQMAREEEEHREAQEVSYPPCMPRPSVAPLRHWSLRHSVSNHTSTRCLIWCRRRPFIISHPDIVLHRYLARCNVVETADPVDSHQDPLSRATSPRPVTPPP
jgi:hypothetical protein